MPQSTSLLATIVIGLVLAFGCGFVASRLHLPPLVGYLLAGIAVGPASQLAEIGVVLLMFGIGLRFSIRDLLTVYPIALPGALAQIATCLVICVTLAVLWGWSWSAGLLFGLGLSVASTVVLLRVLEERGALDHSRAASRSAGSSFRTSRWCWRWWCSRPSPVRLKVIRR